LRSWATSCSVTHIVDVICGRAGQHRRALMRRWCSWRSRAAAFDEGLAAVRPPGA
jgi:hypothetical protein